MYSMAGVRRFVNINFFSSILVISLFVNIMSRR